MNAIIELVMEIVELAPKLAEAGFEVWSILEKARAALDANAAPDDAAWQEADAAVNDLRAEFADATRDV